jgi:hypothetical protein
MKNLMAIKSPFSFIMVTNEDEGSNLTTIGQPSERNKIASSFLLAMTTVLLGFVNGSLTKFDSPRLKRGLVRIAFVMQNEKFNGDKSPFSSSSLHTRMIGHFNIIIETT